MRKITQRQVSLGIIGLLTAGTLLVMIDQVIQGATPIQIALAAGATLVFAGLLYGYRRGWEVARSATVIITTLLTALGYY